jgi:HAD superfamily hydrolase (TIGR01509 family)
VPEDSNNRRAVLFDVDGTLVDTNWFHTLSWWRAFQKRGEDIPMSRIHPLIGMGSSELLTEIFGEVRSDLKDGHTEEFDAFIPELHAFPSAGELVKAVAKRGGRVVMCTSSKQAHLEPMLEEVDVGDAVDEVVNADDVEQSKPAPDVFAAALKKLDIDPQQAIAIGDTTWDVEASKKLDLPCVCVLTGGTEREELERAGAVAVYEDVADLLEHLDDSPIGQLLAESDD